MMLYHITAESSLDSIRERGVRVCSYWSADDNLVDYYTRTIRDEGDTPVVLAVNLDKLDTRHLVPDRPGLQEPITTAPNLSEEEIQEAWKNSSKDWRASLGIIKSLRVDHAIPAVDLQVRNGNLLTPLGAVAPQPKRRML